MYRLRRRYSIVIGLLFVFVLLMTGTSQAVGQRALRDLDTIWGAVWDEYADPFFNGLDWHRLPDSVRPLIEAAESEAEAYQALADMVDRLGDSSTFLVEPQPYFPFYEAEYAGVGIMIGLASTLNEIADDAQFTDDEIAVFEVFEGAPAEEAGVLVGDVIVRVGEWDADEATIDDVSDHIRGEVGTTVQLTLRDPDGIERTVDIVRGRVDLRPRTTFQRIEDDLVYLRLDTLLSEHIDQAKEFIAANADVNHIILDLRGVASGDPNAMSEAATWFLGAVDLGAFESRHDRFALQTATSDDGAPLYANNLTVMIHGGTSGLGEMFALLLSEYDRGTLVGSPSAGGFSLTRVVRLPSGWGLSLSIARYHSPQGRGVHAEGLTPDVLFDGVTLQDLREERDPVLERTIEWIQSAGQ